MISMGIIMGNNQNGTPGAAKTCLQCDLLPLNWVIRKVHIASTNVTFTLPVTLAPKGNIGTSPSRLFISMKKKTVRR